jgi:flagellar capping protein FliD
MSELKNILREGTAKTPLVDFNWLNGELIISGKSIPENANGTYEQLYIWVNEYAKNARQTTNLRLNLEYFNTASSLWLAKIVRSLSKIENPDSLLFIHSYFSIEEYDSMDVEDVKDALSPFVDIINTSNISIGIKIYGTDEKGSVIKESMVLV